MKVSDIVAGTGHGALRTIFSSFAVARENHDIDFSRERKSFMSRTESNRQRVRTIASDVPVIGVHDFLPLGTARW